MASRKSTRKLSSSGGNVGDNEHLLCDMRGMLSFMILWLLAKRPMYGQELANRDRKAQGRQTESRDDLPCIETIEREETSRVALGGPQYCLRVDKIGQYEPCKVN